MRKSHSLRGMTPELVASNITFRCHICGKDVAKGFMFLLSMSDKWVDRPFIICSEACCTRAQISYWTRVKIG